MLPMPRIFSVTMDRSSFGSAFSCPAGMVACSASVATVLRRTVCSLSSRRRRVSVADLLPPFTAVPPSVRCGSPAVVTQLLLSASRAGRSRDAMRVWSGAESEARECSDMETGDSASCSPVDGGESASAVSDKRSSAEWRSAASRKNSGSGGWSDVDAEVERGGIELGGDGVSEGTGLLLERRNSCRPLSRRLPSSFFFSLVGIMDDEAPSADLGRVTAAA